MSEQLPPPPDEAVEPAAVAPKPKQRNLVPWLYGIGFLALAAAVFYLCKYPCLRGEPAAEASAIQAVEQRLADVEQRFADIDGRLTRLEQRFVDIDGRLTRLEQRPTPDLGKITARLDALDGRIVDQTQLASRVDTISGRIESLSGRDQAGLDESKQQLSALTNRIATVESNAGGLDAVTKRLNRIARLQQASFALNAGRPIGDLPDAPEALARYAHAPPPTEAQLRIRFPQDEQAALAVQQPEQANAPLVDRVWERAQGLITIRRGQDVVVGNTASIALGHAQAALDAGDIAGAVNAVESLKGQPAQAMANWLTDAKALLSARSALADMADQA